MSYLKYKAPKRAKDILLDYILSDKGYSLDEKESGTNISKTNWGVYDKEFIQIFVENYYRDYSIFIFKELQKKVVLDNVWYQIYEPNSNSMHDFHNHKKNSDLVHSDISSVFYLELKNQNLLTQFLIDGMIVRPIAEEGDTLTFCSDVYHKSPPNSTDSRKTVIAFNSTFHNF